VAASLFDLSGMLTYREARRATPSCLMTGKLSGSTSVTLAGLFREAMDDTGIPNEEKH